ncbi:hypothetical protein AU193_11645 [Mycobacterium sp. GA-1285]|nr:hypothetical protein AU193_11645 [Mycobacterium sp. GA-1285]
MFKGHSVIGQNTIIQVVFVHEHGIGLDEIRRFNRNLGSGLLGRRIERSPLPFARHRWVEGRRAPDITIVESARPRTDLSAWADERSQQPVDAENGPGWHISVLPLTDGSTAVSLVVSHYLVDGFGLALAIAEALVGSTRDLRYPPPRSRPRLRAAAQDVRQTARDAREVGRALGTAARLARRERDTRSQRVPPPVVIDGTEIGEVVVAPSVKIRVDQAEWDARAEALGGTSRTLVAGFAAKVAEHAERVRARDGVVTLQLPMSERVEDDTRAIALSFAAVSVDPKLVTTDLRDARDAIKHSLETMRQSSEESSQLLWLTPFTPKRTLKRVVTAGIADPDRPVLCSNLGDLGAVVFAVTGSDAEYATVNAHLKAVHNIRVTGQHMTRSRLDRLGGHMTVQAWRIDQTVHVSVEVYQPGGENMRADLRELVKQTLDEFNLTGQID